MRSGNAAVVALVMKRHHSIPHELMRRLLAVAKAARFVNISRKYPGNINAIYPELEKALEALEKE